MKKIILSVGLILFSLIAISQNYNVSVYGIVTDINSGLPVQNQEMYITTDSMAGGTSYYNTVYTDASGFYIDTIQVGAGEQGVVEVSTMSCGIFYTEMDFFSPNNTSIVLDFQVCNDTMNSCLAMFTYYPTQAMSIQFLDESLGNPNVWTWDFGDGNTSSVQNPLHSYTTPGIYDVVLSIENDSTQCTSSIVQTIIVDDSIWPGGCQAMWVAYPDSNNYFTYIFQDMSYTSSGQISSWYWDFGDGSYSNDPNPVHTYSQDGNYDVCLTITDLIDSCENTYCFMVVVGNWQPECEAMYYYYPVDSTNTGNWNMNNIQFMDMSFGNPDSWYWEFGDGNSSTEQNPIHYFQDDGIYQVCLTITNSMDSCVSSYCDLIAIINDTLPGCNTWFTYELNDIEVEFTAFIEGSTGLINYDWNFGDGQSGTGESIIHTYAEPGVYDVLLSAYDSAGCYSSYMEQIWVGEVTFSINGHIYLIDSLLTADYADVHLMTFDTLGNGLINLETTQIDGNGYYSFESVGYQNCIYFVQAELTSQSAYYGQYLPTYHLDALNWEQAWPIFPYPINWWWPNDVYMVQVSSSNSGDGLISGTVTNENGRTILEDFVILLYNDNGEAITYKVTNESGGFDFSDLEFGTYTVYTEIVGINTEPIQITLTEDSPEANINIVVKNGEAILGIGEQSSTTIESFNNIFPNPVIDIVTLNLNIKENTSVDIEIFNQFGQVVYEKNKHLSTGNQDITFDISNLSEGIYMMSISGNDNIRLIRKFIKLR